LAKIFAVLAPMPDAAPVTIATLPASLMVSSSLQIASHRPTGWTTGENDMLLCSRR
jgi:hypothetical protein